MERPSLSSSALTDLASGLLIPMRTSLQHLCYSTILVPDAYNQTLSERRAEAVRSFLVIHGVDAARIATVGYGKSHPITSNATNAGRAQNRRVEMKVMKP